MPGRQKRPITETDRLQYELKELRQRCADYEKIIARVDPDTVMQRLPEPIDEYQEDLPERVLALAVLGMFAREIRAELGITAKQWAAWRTAHNRFYAATSRAKDIAAAYWVRLSREALEDKDWKFPHSQMTSAIKAMKDDDESEVERGDASELVIFDGNKGRAAINANAGKPVTN